MVYFDQNSIKIVSRVYQQWVEECQDQAGLLGYAWRGVEEGDVNYHPLLPSSLWRNLCKGMMMIACKVHEVREAMPPKSRLLGVILLAPPELQKQIFRWCRNGHLCTISFHLEAFCRCKFEAGLAQHATIAQWRLAQLNIIGGKKCSRSWQTPKGPPAWPFVETPSPGLRTKAISKELISRHFCQSG